MTPLHRPVPPRLASSPSASRIHSRNASRQDPPAVLAPSQSLIAAPYSDHDPPSPLTHQLALASDTVERLAARLAGVQERTTSRTRAGSLEGSLEASVDNVVAGGGAGAGDMRCCCEERAVRTGEVLESGTCAARDALVAMEKDLELSATIGQALLERYEALSAKHSAIGQDHDNQGTLLASTLTQCANLERANDTHLKRYGELSRKNEGLEKRLAQMHHTQQLTSTTLLSLRSELTTLRRTHRDEAASSDAHHAALTEAYERDRAREDAAADLQARVRLVEGALAEAERTREEEKARRGALEEELRTLKAGRGGGVNKGEHLVQAARKRVEDLVNQLQDPMNPETPEFQRTLESLVADNVVAQHTAATLSGMLASASEESQTLHRENDELRAALGVAPRTPRLGEADHEDEDERDLRNTSLLARSSGGVSAGSDLQAAARRRPVSIHPSVGSRDRKYSWTPSLAASIASSGGRNSILAIKRESLTPSLQSTGAQSPRHALAPAAVLRDAGSSPAREDDTHAPYTPPLDGLSPRPRNSVGLGYTLNGMPKRSNSIAGSSQGRRAFSADRPNVQRAFSSGVDSIAEWSGTEDESGEMAPPRTILASPISPAAETRRETMRRKRLTLNPSVSYSGVRSPQHSRLFDVLPFLQGDRIDSPSSFADGPSSPAATDRRDLRRQILLLTSSKAVQTDLVGNEDAGGGDPGLGALGYQPTESTAPASTNIMSSFSPAQTQTSHTEHSETSSLHDTRSAALPHIIEHMQKLLGKIRQADVPTLTRRLRRQHLPGDVSHLSQSTMRALAVEVGELRTHFKAIVDHEREIRPDTTRRHQDSLQESAISRRDLALLLRLFKEAFASMVELQATINKVIIDPSSAAKLKIAAEAVQDEDGDPKAKAAKSATGLGWIAAPLAKYFVGAPVDAAADDAAAAKSRLDGGRLQPPRPAPKLTASTLATTTHVNVEFGGSGTVKRATSTMPSTQVDHLPPSPADTLTRGVTAPSAIKMSRSGPTVTLAEGSSRGVPPRRDDLLGIFAGAPSGPRAAGVHRLRTATSQNFGTGRSVSNGHKRQISSAVDAVIDQPLPEDKFPDESGNPIPGRRLRPRGLSDSSIRSTFVSQDAAGPALPSSTPRQQATGLKRSDTQSRSMMHQLGRRFQALTGVGLAPAKPAAAEPQRVPDDDPVPAPESLPTPPLPTLKITQPTLPRPAIATSSRTPTSSSPATRGGPGFLSMFAGSGPDGVHPADQLGQSLAEEYPDGIGGLSISYSAEPGSMLRRAYNETT